MATEGDLDFGPDGRWRVFHKMIGEGHAGQWVHSPALDDWLRNEVKVTRVDGSGGNMKLYSSDDPDAPVILDMRKPAHFRAFAQKYNLEFGKSGDELGERAAEQGAPVNIKDLWKKIYPDVDFPDLQRRDWQGQLMEGTVDMEQFTGVIEAMEARVGDLTRYGFNKNADYQVVPLGDQYESDIVISNGKVTKIDKTEAGKPSYRSGLRGDIGSQLPGYDVLQQPTGALSTVQQRMDPQYIIDPKTMQPYFQQPDGSLTAAPVPSVDDQISMHLVEGNLPAAVNKANFRDRPSSLEYFNAAMEWARTPADIFTISAIVRGIFEPAPGPMGELRRVGAPPAWATQAWVGLQNSMGIPTENMTAVPNGEIGQIDPTIVSGATNLVPNNFVTTNSAPITLDGKTVTAAPSQTITPDTVVQALDNDGNIVGTMTADMANTQGYDFSGKGQFGDTSKVPAPTPTPTTAPTPTPKPAPVPVPTAASSVPNLKRIWDVENQRYVTLNVNDPDSAEQYNWYLTQEGYLGEGEAGFGVERTGPPAAAKTRTIYNQAGESWTLPADQADIWLGTDDWGETPNWFDTGEGMEGDGLSDEEAEILADAEQRVADLFAAREERAESREEWASGFATEEDDYLASFAGDSSPQDFGFSELEDFYGGAAGEELSFADALANIDPYAEGAGTYDPGNMYDPMFDEGAPFSPGSLWWQEAEKEFPGGQRPMTEAEKFPSSPAGRGYETEGYPEDWLTETQPGIWDAYSQFANKVWPWGDEDVPMPVGNVGQNLPRPAAIETRDPRMGWENLPIDAADNVYEKPDYYDYAYDPMFRDVPAEEVSEPPHWSFESTDARVREHLARTAVDEPVYEDEPDEEIFDDFDYDGVYYEPEPVYEPEPEPEPVSEPSFEYYEEPYYEEPVFEVDMPEPEDYMGTGASEEAYWSSYDEGAKGTRTGDRFTLVGEEGPELALFPRGTEIVPLNRPAKPKQRRRIRTEFDDAIDSFAFGGYSSGGTAMVGEMGPELVDLPPGAQVMPAGITEMMTGRPTRKPKSLFRQAGMRAPSAQTISNLLPEEIEVYQEMGRLAGIPEKAFEREFRSMVPMGQGGTRQARFTPRGTGRTRYGNR